MIFQSQANLGSLLMIDAICSACLVISYHDRSMLQSPHPVKTFCAAIERGVCDNESWRLHKLAPSIRPLCHRLIRLQGQ